MFVQYFCYMEERQNRIILCLGSNLDKEKNIELADRELRARFDFIIFSEPVYTESIDCPIPSLFLNQVVFAYSPDGIEDIQKDLKEIERLLGRKSQDKFSGYVPVDIDLLQWNEQILKPEDLNRPYVLTGIQSILSALPQLGLKE